MPPASTGTSSGRTCATRCGRSRRTPAFALTAITVVALGIGATTAAFSLADFVLIRPLPFPEADRLVRFSEERPGFPRMELAPANYRDLKQMATSFEASAPIAGSR